MNRSGCIVWPTGSTKSATSIYSSTASTKNQSPVPTSTAANEPTNTSSKTSQKSRKSPNPRIPTAKLPSNNPDMPTKTDVSTGSPTASVLGSSKTTISSIPAFQSTPGVQSTRNAAAPHKNTGKILGGVLGGIAVFIFLVFAAYLIWRRRQVRRTPPSAEFLSGASQPFLGRNWLLPRRSDTSRIRPRISSPEMKERSANPFDSPPMTKLALPK